MKKRWVAFSMVLLLLWGSRASAKSCVWKVIGPDGGTLYLGGSFHALRPTDYPLPPAFNAAFDACSRLAFEQDPKTATMAMKAMLKSGKYSKGDSLKNHVDPRTYEYLKRFFTVFGMQESTYDSLRPWLIDLLLSSPPPSYYELGVERFMERRAAANAKPIIGLESTAEHNRVFSGLNDRESEALLLTLFINAGRDKPAGQNAVDAWRRGDVEFLARSVHEGYRDFPMMATRLLDDRNRSWIPKIEKFLRSGQTYFVMVGAGHMGGPNGLLALLQARGYKIEQL